MTHQKEKFVLLNEILRILKPFWPIVVVATVTGVISGLATTKLLAIINSSLRENELVIKFWVAFSVLLLIAVAGSAFAGGINSYIGQKIIASMRKEISAKILKAPINAIEQYQSHRILASLNNDIDTVSAFTFNFSGYAINFAVALAGMIYLLYLSPIVFAISLVFLFSGMFLTSYSRRIWIKDYEGVRDAQDNLQKNYRAIIEGAKELRINRIRRQKVYRDGLCHDVDMIAGLKCHAMIRMWIIDGISSALFFIAIGFMLLGKHTIDSNNAVISAAVIILLYIKHPFEQLAGALAVMEQAKVSMKRLALLSEAFSNSESDILLDSDQGKTPRFQEPIKSLKMENVAYRYSGTASFALGPVNLVFLPGEITFIVGDNGSGKTTLIKVLLGLYDPQEGAILINGSPVAREEKDEYRQLFTTVFSDYFLFDDIAYSHFSVEQSDYYLEKLKIAGQVEITDGHFSTTDLSTGQRKRLALVHAYLENRPIIIFDEWAADQDPTFRHVFYTELLPELKARGKIILVISHDDRYFGIADKVIHLSKGVIQPVIA